MRRPVAIENFPPLEDLDIADSPFEEFSLQFLKSQLNGEQYANGWYVTNPMERRPPQVRPFPQVTSFMILEGDHDPLLPRFLGDHGVQITAIVQET